MLWLMICAGPLTSAVSAPASEGVDEDLIVTPNSADVVASTTISYSSPKEAGGNKAVCGSLQLGYAADAHVLLRFDALPKVANPANIASIRLGLWAQATGCGGFTWPPSP